MLMLIFIALNFVVAHAIQGLLQKEAFAIESAIDIADESDDTNGNALHSEVELDFCDATHAMNLAKHDGFAQPSANNLGNKGPEIGEESIRFRDVFPGKGVDLKVVAEEGYTPKNPAVNGIVNGVYGTVNIQSGTSVFLTFMFVNSQTGVPVEVPSFMMTFFDFDANRLGSATESVKFFGVSSYYTSENTELDLSNNTDGSLTVTATQFGNKHDNPISPLALTTLMKNRAISITFKPLSEFSIKFESTPSGKNRPGGRNLMFGGPSSLQCPPQNTCDTFTCPLGMIQVPFAKFTNGADAGTCCANKATCSTHTCSPGKVLIAKPLETDCAGLACASTDDLQCCEKESAACSSKELRLKKLRVNNLGGQGPDIGTDHTITFGNVFPDNDVKVDLVISAVGSYVPYSSAKNGRRGKFGALNVKSGEEAVLRFKFVNADTGATVTVPPFLFSIYDLDSGKSDETVYEYVELSGYKGYKTSETTEVLAEPTSPSSGIFYGNTLGYGFDNPKGLFNLTELQKKRLVSFEFPPTGEFNLDFGATPGGGGRNLYFAGRSSLYCS